MKLAIALGFSLNRDGLFTVTFTKYRISASPGKPVKDGGNVVLMCCVGAFANSGMVFAKEMFEIGAVACAWQEVFSVIYGMLAYVQRAILHDSP